MYCVKSSHFSVRGTKNFISYSAPWLAVTANYLIWKSYLCSSKISVCYLCAQMCLYSNISLPGYFHHSSMKLIILLLLYFVVIVTTILTWGLFQHSSKLCTFQFFLVSDWSRAKSWHPIWNHKNNTVGQGLYLISRQLNFKQPLLNSSLRHQWNIL